MDGNGWVRYGMKTRGVVVMWKLLMIPVYFDNAIEV